MAASDEFPRFWTATTQTTNPGQALITVPAAPGICRVLDSFTAEMENAGAAVAGLNISVSSSDGLYSGFIIGLLVIVGAGGKDEASGVSLGLATSPGSSLTVGFNTVAGVGTVQTLIIQGHDI